LNFFADRQPVGRYGYLFPWVLEDGLPDIIGGLQDREAIVALDLEGRLGPFENKIWMEPVKGFLAENYEYLGQGIWRSPGLRKSCAAIAVPSWARWSR
jgi:hypothetical protein